MTELTLGKDELRQFLDREFPQVAGDLSVESVTPERMILRLNVGPQHLRPGGTVSGPSLFMLADAGLYLAILARIGLVPLAVTTNASIDFLRKPAAGRDVLAEVEILKLGRNLVVGQAMLRSDGDRALVARANLTYAIPPKM